MLATVFGIRLTNVLTSLAKVKLRSSRSYCFVRDSFIVSISRIPLLSRLEYCIWFFFRPLEFASGFDTWISCFLLGSFEFVSDFEIRASDLSAHCEHSFHFA